VSCLAVRGPTRGENQAETVWERIYRVSLPSGWTLNYWVTVTASSAFCIWQGPGPDLRFTQIRLHFNGVIFCAIFDIMIPRAPHLLAVTVPLKKKQVKKVRRWKIGQQTERTCQANNFLLLWESQQSIKVFFFLDLAILNFYKLNPRAKANSWED